MIQEESVHHNSIKMYPAHVVDRGLDSAVLGVTPSRYDDSLETCWHDVPSGWIYRTGQEPR